MKRAAGILTFFIPGMIMGCILMLAASLSSCVAPRQVIALTPTIQQNRPHLGLHYLGSMQGIGWKYDIEVYSPYITPNSPREQEFTSKFFVEDPVFEVSKETGIWQMEDDQGRNYLVRLIPKTNSVLILYSDTIYFNWIGRMEL